MKMYLLSLCLIVLTVSCKRDNVVSNNACTAADPLIVPWVKTLTATLNNPLCLSSLFQARYKGQTVYYAAMNDPTCESIPGRTLLDCTGQTIKIYGPTKQEQQAFADEVSVVKTLYVSKRT